MRLVEQKFREFFSAYLFTDRPKIQQQKLEIRIYPEHPHVSFRYLRFSAVSFFSERLYSSPRKVIFTDFVDGESSLFLFYS